MLPYLPCFAAWNEDSEQHGGRGEKRHHAGTLCRPVGHLPLRTEQGGEETSAEDGDEAEVARGVQHRTGRCQRRNTCRRRAQQKVYSRNSKLHACRIRVLFGRIRNQKAIKQMIELQGITKSFGSLQVLRGIDLTIERGEVVSIVGPSGAGKTTLLQIMGTLDKPDSGSIRLNGVEVNRLGEKKLSAFRNKEIGFVFQFHQLLPEFTALENVTIPALIQGVSAGTARKQAQEMLDMLGLSERAAHKPAELSGGEKQRVAVARALINHPSVVLADEPSGSLDTQNKEELHRLFFDLRDKLGQTFVIVTHDEGLAAQTDRTIHLVDGQIVR